MRELLDALLHLHVPQLPILDRQFRLWQFSHLPRLPAATVPVDPCVAERRKTQSQVTPIEALRVPTDCNDRPVENPTGQFSHLATQAILCLIGKAAAEARE